ncbi:MAG: amidohydrolase family protein [Bacteroidia bacterium]|nr:amidohydrolase family protein [Bacteroidia bacterium]
MKYPTTSLFILFLCISQLLSAQTTTDYILLADRVFDGKEMHENWGIWVKGNKIHQIGPQKDLASKQGIRTIELRGKTLLPGLIEGHSHLLLHPYDEVSWNDQVLKESHAERAIRAGVHAEKTLLAGFTTVRDLGSEGAGYTDVGVKESIEKGIIPGPRMLVAGPAIVATGSYGPKGFADHVHIPLGAEEADGHDDLIKVVRRQIGGGADFIKVYADYRWGPNKEARPTFSIEELKLIVETAASSGRVVVAHAASPEAMKRAILAGVKTIEHGDGGTKEVFDLMKEKGVALCPTLAAGDAITQYKGWKKGIDPEPERIQQKRKSFALALQAGVLISAGGDVGVFSHGDNVRELEMMVEYGMEEKEVLISATSLNADLFDLGGQLGKLQEGFLADIIAVEGNPLENISQLRNVHLVMKNGELILLKE